MVLVGESTDRACGLGGDDMFTDTTARGGVALKEDTGKAKEPKPDTVAG